MGIVLFRGWWFEVEERRTWGSRWRRGDGRVGEGRSAGARNVIPTGDLADLLLRTLYALGSDPELTVQQQPMAEEFAFPNRSDGALFAVDAQPEFPFQKLHHRFHHSLPRRQRPHVDVAVVGVTAEAMAPAIQ